MGVRRKRKVWSDAEKRTICAQTRVAGVSVSQVARRYDANANLVFTWLRDARFRPNEGTAEGQTAFLPVEVIEERREARRDVGAPAPAPAALATVEGCIELELAGGHRLRVTGAYDPDALARLIRGLAS